METIEYQKMFGLEDEYWWFVARRRLVISLLKSLQQKQKTMILDLGCGTGAMLKGLAGFGAAFGLDTAGVALDFCRKRDSHSLIESDVANLGIKSSSFDLLTVLDVFEHMDDDQAGFRECFRVLKNGGYVISTVPAYGFLWSEHDQALSHKRRYTASRLKAGLESAGFKIEKLSYVITSFFFPILLFRIFQKLLPKRDHPETSLLILPERLNRLLIFVLNIEAGLLKWINLPFGVSVVCVARKEVKSQK